MRRSDLLFHAGGECVRDFGTIVRRNSVASDFGYTHTRSGAVGPYVSPDGVMLTAAANVPRIDWDSGVPYLLLEPARTNLVDSDDFSAWTNQNTTTVTGSVSDPAGGTGAYTISGDGGASSEGRYRGVTFTGDGVKSAVFVVKEETMPASGNQQVAIYDAVAAAFRLQLDITAWTNGEPTVSAATGTLLNTRLIGDGWWAIYGQTTSVTAANGHRAYVYSNVSASAGEINVFRANAFDSETPSDSILAASETRNADTLYADFHHAPQAMTIYVRALNAGVIETGSFVRLLQIGNTGTSSERILSLQVNAANELRAVHENADGTGSVSSVSGVEPAYRQDFEARLVLNANGSVNCGAAVDSGAESEGGNSSAKALLTSWSDPRLNLGASGGTGTGVLLRAIKVARGVRTMGEMRAV